MRPDIAEVEARRGKTEADGVEPPPHETIHHLARYDKQNDRGTQAGVT